MVTIQMRLEDMAIVLFEAGELFRLRHASGDRRRRWWRSHGRRDERPRSRWQTGVDTTVEQEISLVWRSHAVGRRFQRGFRHRPDKMRRDDHHKLAVLVLEAGRAEQGTDDR